jgi:hypothetical protein
MLFRPSVYTFMLSYRQLALKSGKGFVCEKVWVMRESTVLFLFTQVMMTSFKISLVTLRRYLFRVFDVLKSLGLT